MTRYLRARIAFFNYYSRWHSIRILGDTVFGGQVFGDVNEFLILLGYEKIRLFNFKFRKIYIIYYKLFVQIW